MALRPSASKALRGQDCQPASPAAAFPACCRHRGGRASLCRCAAAPGVSPPRPALLLTRSFISHVSAGPADVALDRPPRPGASTALIKARRFCPGASVGARAPWHSMARHSMVWRGTARPPPRPPTAAGWAHRGGDFSRVTTAADVRLLAGVFQPAAKFLCSFAEENKGKGLVWVCSLSGSVAVVPGPWMRDVPEQ